MFMTTHIRRNMLATHSECLLDSPCIFTSQGVKPCSAETERTQSQMDCPESLWILERDDILSIGIEEVSTASWTLILPTESPRFGSFSLTGTL